ncbi:universal stress protein [Georgenia yuyongxinii]|uniref:Universal stress protein n=1 Tax=Georgenia yuyongxinii TaxID=2589797 RepID=A0A552WL15_9MICO|nr:universal stress protein [Georgenia yuyongxinii]TRW43364.1 universal stress protein [Georgenia yuyongxinii]
MTDTDTSGTVVVGVDGSEGDAGIVDWAADEAARRGAPLLVLYAYAWGVPLPMAFAAGKEVTDPAVARARARHPGLAVQGLEVLGHAVTALADASRRASLLVLGAKGASAGRFGSVVERVMAHAGCPVVVLSGGREPRRGPVVVWVDTADGARPVLELALAVAGGRGVPVQVVQARPGDGAGLARLMTECAEAHPQVPVTLEEVSGTVAAALLDRAGAATLVVVGTPAGHHLSRAAREVVDGAPAVAVVPVPAGTRSSTR